MFDLEKSIAEWRKQMLAAGIKTPVPLEELELHLREDARQQMNLGANAQHAFEVAVQRIGTPESIGAEFNKTNQRTIMKRILLISTGIIAVLVGLGFVMPAVAQYRHTGAMTNEEVVLFLLGSVLVLAGGITALSRLKRRKA